MTFYEQLEQIIQQNKITNGLLALLVIATSIDANADDPMLLSEQERLACIALARMAFNDPSRILKAATDDPSVS